MNLRSPGLFTILLISSVLVFCLMAAINDEQIRGILDVLMLAILTASVVSVRRKQRRLVVTLAIGSAATLASLTQLLIDHRFADVIATVLYLAFLAYAVVVFLAYVLRPEDVTTDKISAAICVYLLIGAIWANLYLLVEVSHPGSFRMPSTTDLQPGPERSGGIAAIDADTPMHLLDRRFLYYSIVTLTTVGYGDITPAAPLARALSAVEAIVGQMYVAILVARLVGLHLAHSTESRKARS